MNLICYPKLATKSRRAISRKYWKGGRVYQYNPRYDLVHRLSIQLNLTIEQIYLQLEREREYILSKIPD